MLLPFFEEEGLHSLYDNDRPWFFQYAEVARTAIPVFVCPSGTGDNPFQDLVLNRLLILLPGHYTADQELGATTYAFCKGVLDSWCFGAGFGPPGPPFTDKSPNANLKIEADRGLFDINWASPIRKIADGTANTIALGEGAGGPAWPIAAWVPRGAPNGDPNFPDRWKPFTFPGIEQRNAHMAWIIAEPSFDPLTSAIGIIGSCVTACTLEPMNKNPVTGAWAMPNFSGLSNCRRSLPAARGRTSAYCTPGPNGVATTPSQCGVHIANNFRSDHPGGCNFLFADGSVHFLAEDIDMLTYQNLSTMMANDIVEIPGD
jgi:prepilin-type processing-associated H-X9-DG protein